MPAGLETPVLLRPPSSTAPYRRHAISAECSIPSGPLRAKEAWQQTALANLTREEWNVRVCPDLAKDIRGENRRKMEGMPVVIECCGSELGGRCTTPEAASQGVARGTLLVDYTIDLTSTWSTTPALNRSCDSLRSVLSSRRTVLIRNTC